MSDLRDRICAILQQPQLAGLATITQDGKPWVRYVMTLASDDLIIRCATFVGARIKVFAAVRNEVVNPENADDRTSRLLAGLTATMKIDPSRLVDLETIDDGADVAVEPADESSASDTEGASGDKTAEGESTSPNGQ